MAVLGRIGHPSTTTHGPHTMTISLYQSSVPVFVRTLGNLSRILDKAVAHAADKGLDASTLVNARLAPDMFPLARQVQSACDAAKLATARLSGVQANPPNLS